MSMLFKRIKDWAVSITSFRNGDVIPVDGPNGTAKMGYSDLAKEVIKDSANNPAATEADLVAGSTLPIMTANGPKSLPGNALAKASEQASLSTYAQNVAHSIAPEFNPNSTTTVAGYPYIYGGKLYVAKEAYCGPWDLTKFTGPKDVLNATLIENPNTSSAPYNDLDTFPLNRLVSVNDSSNVSNLPYKVTSVLVYTVGVSDNFRLQFLSGQNRQFYVRCKFGNEWGGWSGSGNVFVINPTTTESPYNDLDTYPLNSIVMVSSTGANVSHRPVGVNGFLCYTYGVSASLATQIFSAQNGKCYMRVKWGSSWNEWLSLTGNDYVANPTTTESPYNDLDSYPLNSIVMVSSTGANVSHRPVGVNGFLCYTYGVSASLATQIFSAQTKEVYVRSKWVNTWGAWNKIGSEDQVPCDVLSAFTNIVCVGDSLTESAVWVSNDGAEVRRAYKTYPQVLQTITGATVTNLSKGGDSASDSWNRWKNTFVEKDNALAIVYLGTNQGLTDTLDVDAPVADPYTDWADTNTGCYAKIIAKLQELGYKVLLIKCWTVSVSASLEITNNVIEQVGTRFGCSVVGPIINNELQYHYWPDRTGYNVTHYNDLGYSWFAHRLCDVVTNLGDNLKYIVPE